MKITSEHIFFYRQKQPCPSWIKENTKERKADIDLLINSQVGKSTTKDHKLHNTLILLKMARKSGRLLDCLKDCSNSSENHRSAYCKKWLKRLKQS